MECTVCRQTKQITKEIKYPCFPCDSCRNLICSECSQLSATELRCLPMGGRLLKYHCKKCRNYDMVEILQNTIKDKDNLISDKNEIIKLLQDKVKELEERQDIKISKHPTSYASAVMKPVENTSTSQIYNYPNIVIKPKIAQSVQQTRKDIDSYINPANLRIGVKQFKVINSGSIIIKCATKQETQTLQNEMNIKLKDKYNVELTKMRKPRIKIVNFRQDMDSEEIENSFKRQNELNDDVKVTYIKKTKADSKIIFCELSPNSFNKIMKEQKVYIGWEKYPVYEDLEIPRCYKCQAFYHKVQECPNRQICPLCSEEHEEKNCPKQRKCCQNCITSNGKYKTQYETDHHATDRSCPTLEYQKQILRNKTDYTGW